MFPADALIQINLGGPARDGAFRDYACLLLWAALANHLSDRTRAHMMPRWSSHRNLRNRAP
jgi:hypothetical protein